MHPYAPRSCPELISQANGERPLNLFRDNDCNILAARWRHKDCWLPVHNAAQYILCYHESGSSQVHKFEHGKRVGEFSAPSSLTFIPCDGTEWEIFGECQVVHVYLESALMDGFIQSQTVQRQSIEPFFSVQDPWLEAYFKVLLAECELYGPQVDSLLLAQSRAALVRHLFKWYACAHRPSTDATERPSIPPHRLRAVIDYIETHYTRDITLKELAGVACLSEFHFSRCFKQALGTSPYRFVVQKRLLAAAKLLTGSAVPIQTIAHNVGFTNARYFSAAFRDWSGKSPREYRLN